LEGKYYVESLRSHFEVYGNVSDCVLMVDKVTGKKHNHFSRFHIKIIYFFLTCPIGRSRGFGFVTMQDSSLVDKILMEKPHILDGKSVNICPIPIENHPLMHFLLL
jgi:hypothetical protein